MGRATDEFLKEAKEQVRRYAERRRTQAATWKAIGRETGQGRWSLTTRARRWEDGEDLQ